MPVIYGRDGWIAHASMLAEATIKGLMQLSMRASCIHGLLRSLSYGYCNGIALFSVNSHTGAGLIVKHGDVYIIVKTLEFSLEYG